ncbi:MAG: hypothetical protein WBB23_09065 [Desulforhopalus sp.]
MKDNDLKNQVTPEYPKSSAATGEQVSVQDEQGGSTKAQAKETLEKVSHTVEEAYEKTADKVGEAYEKIAPAVNKTYAQTKEYSVDNPGKTILIALGIGVGIGFIWGSNTRHSRGGRYARPIVNAVSDVAMEFFR